MSDWPLTRIGDVAKQTHDAVKIAPGEEYRLLGVKWYGEGPFHRETVTSETSKATKIFRVSAGQFIYNRLFAWKGSFGLVGDDLDGAYVSNEFPLFVCDSSRLLPEYLNLHFRQPSVWAHVEQASTGTTASRNRWKEAQFAEFRIALPPVAEQRRIVDAMASLDAHVDSLVFEIAQLTRLLARVRDGYPDASKRAVSEIVLGVDSGKSVATSEERPGPGEPSVLKLSAIQLGSFVADQAKRLDDLSGYSEKHLVANGDLLITRASGSTDRIGYVAIARDVPSGTYLPDLIWRIRPNTGICSSLFLRHLLSAPSMRSSITSAARGTASMRKINKAILGALQLPVPTLEMQNEYTERCDVVAEMVARSTVELASLRAVRSTVGAALLAQEIQIPESYDSFLPEAVS